MAERGDVYISADVEADGPIPGKYSMLSIGLVVAGRFDGRSFLPEPPPEATFYRELKPISPEFDKAALEVSGFDRGLLQREGCDPLATMTDAATWVQAQAREDRPVLVGYPAVFDWMFIHWYFVAFLGASPFGFSGALDMKTMYQQKARVTLDLSGRTDLPPDLSPTMEHSHHALDDAKEQAEIFRRLFSWPGRQK